MTTEIESRHPVDRQQRRSRHRPSDSLMPTRTVPVALSAAQWYQERKRDLILAALPERRYRLALDPGCGDGLVAAGLAARCQRVLAWDQDLAAVEACRLTIAPLANVEVRAGRVPEDWPTEEADLVVLSEIGYHMDGQTLDRMVDRARTGLALGGTLIAAHRRDTPAEFALNGDDVHAHLFGRIGLTRVGGYADEELRIDVFVAESQG